MEHFFSLYSREKQDELAGCIIFTTISEPSESEVYMEISVSRREHKVHIRSIHIVVLIYLAVLGD